MRCSLPSKVSSVPSWRGPPLHAGGDARLLQHGHGALLEHAGADARQHVVRRLARSRITASIPADAAAGRAADPTVRLRRSPPVPASILSLARPGAGPAGPVASSVLLYHQGVVHAQSASCHFRRGESLRSPADRRRAATISGGKPRKATAPACRPPMRPVPITLPTRSRFTAQPQRQNSMREASRLLVYRDRVSCVGFSHHFSCSRPSSSPAVRPRRSSPCACPAMPRRSI